MKTNSAESGENNLQRTQNPKPIKIKKDLDNSSRYKVPIPIRISALSDDKIY